MTPRADPSGFGKRHGGGLDAVRARYGGTDWLDLSTGINPNPYPIPDLQPGAWTSLPDGEADAALTRAARLFWAVPEAADILAAPGASALIARLPSLARPGRAIIAGPTYNEHASAFAAAGWTVAEDGPGEARIRVNPNNPDGRTWPGGASATELDIIDESFCDVTPNASLVAMAEKPGTVILKSFGKFWGLAGLRLGFAIGPPDTIERLRVGLGPWPVSGPALAIGAAALLDQRWAATTHERLALGAARLDALMAPHGHLVGGTTLFRLWDVGDAEAFRDRLARHRIWTRAFDYSESWIRLGLPPADGWSRLEAALA